MKKMSTKHIIGIFTHKFTLIKIFSTPIIKILRGIDNHDDAKKLYPNFSCKFL